MPNPSGNNGHQLVLLHDSIQHVIGDRMLGSRGLGVLVSSLVTESVEGRNAFGDICLSGVRRDPSQIEIWVLLNGAADKTPSPSALGPSRSEGRVPATESSYN